MANPKPEPKTFNIGGMEWQLIRSHDSFCFEIELLTTAKINTPGHTYIHNAIIENLAKKGIFYYGSGSGSIRSHPKESIRSNIKDESPESLTVTFEQAAAVLACMETQIDDAATLQDLVSHNLALCRTRQVNRKDALKAQKMDKYIDAIVTLLENNPSPSRDEIKQAFDKTRQRES